VGDDVDAGVELRLRKEPGWEEEGMVFDIEGACPLVLELASVGNWLDQ
jgi:hypothetical protein